MGAILLGVCIIVVAILLSLILQNGTIFPKITGIVGLTSILLSVIVSGILGSGDRIRANFSTEDSEDRNSRNKLWKSLFLFAIPNLAVSIIYSLI